MKKYIKPEVEILEFVIDEEITSEILSGDTGMGDPEDGWV